MKSTFLPEALTRHAIGDFDGDGVDEAAVDFGGMGSGCMTAAAGAS